MKKPNQAEPDVLVMTATPIPRTLALSLYGDLDVSVLDELPPGRTPIVTRRVPGERAEEVWDFVRKQVAQGRQAYIVYPVIEGAKDDQPELDFSHDEPEADARTASAACTANPRAKGQDRGAVSAKPRRRRIRPRNPGSSPPSKCTRSCAPARSPACAWACSTAASMPTRKRSSCAAFSAARSTCWSPPRSSKSASMFPTPR